MLPTDKLLANTFKTNPLYHAQALLRNAIQKQLDNVLWVLRGSTMLNDALNPKLTGRLDLDCFLILPCKASIKQSCLIIAEIISITCLKKQWPFVQRQIGYRVTIQNYPQLTIDLTILRNSSSKTELLSTGGYVMSETDVLKPRLTPMHILACPPFQCAWLNFKLWAKLHVPWESRPNTHVLRSLAVLHARQNNEHKISAGWIGYVQFIRSICDQLEGNDLIRSLMQISPLSNEENKIINSFLPLLRSYVDPLKYISSEEHTKLISNIHANRLPLRVFVSSRQREFFKLRMNLAANAPQNIHFLLSEHFFPWNMAAYDGIAICEAKIDSADVFVGIYGKEYGINSPNRYGSPIDEELKHARSKLSYNNIFLFSRVSAFREHKLTDFLHCNSDISVLPLHEDIDAATHQLMCKLLSVASNNVTTKDHLRTCTK